MKPESLLKEDIGIDSLDFVDIAVFVEEEMGFRIKAEDKRNMKTFGDFCDYLAENIK